MGKANLGWTSLLVANVVVWCVLGFDGTSTAAPDKVKQPFGNSVQQRGEMIRELKQISALLKEQNALLSAGMAKGKPDGKRPR